MGFFHDFLKNMKAQEEATTQAESAEQNKQILETEGANYDTNSHYIDNAVVKFTQGWPEEDILALFPAEGHPSGEWEGNKKMLMRKFLANVGKSVSETTMIPGDTSGKSISDQLDEVMKSPEYQNGFGKAHQEAVNKALKLREMLLRQGQS
jgi:hypothetical protein